VTIAEQAPAEAGCVIFAGQMMLGGVASVTVTVNVHCAVLFELSVAVQVTVVVPLLKVDPEAGLQATLTPRQLSDPVGVV
jgi:hypothetical protein